MLSLLISTGISVFLSYTIIVKPFPDSWYIFLILLGPPFVVLWIDIAFQKRSSKLIYSKFEEYTFYPFSELFYKIDWKSFRYYGDGVSLPSGSIPGSLYNIVKKIDNYEIKGWTHRGIIDGKKILDLFTTAIKYCLFSYDFQNNNDPEVRFSLIIIQIQKYSMIFLAKPKEIKLERILDTEINYTVQIISRIPIISRKFIASFYKDNQPYPVLNPFSFFTVGVLEQEDLVKSIREFQTHFLHVKIRSIDPENKLVQKLKHYPNFNIDVVSERVFFNRVLNTFVNSRFRPEIYQRIEPLGITAVEGEENQEDLLKCQKAISTLLPFTQNDDPTLNLYYMLNGWKPDTSISNFTRYLENYQYRLESLGVQEFNNLKHMLLILEKTCQNFVDIYSGFLKTFNYYQFDDYADIVYDMSVLISIIKSVYIKIINGTLKPANPPIQEQESVAQAKPTAQLISSGNLSHHADFLAFLEEQRLALIDFIGEGDSNYVFRVHDKNVNDYRALRISKEIINDERNFDEISKQDAKMMQISNPNLIKYHNGRAVTISGGRHWAVTQDYFDGKSLKKLDQQIFDFTLFTRLNMALSLVDGVGELHKNLEKHNDLHTGNILINKEGVLRVTDPGISISTRNEKSKDDLESVRSIILNYLLLTDELPKEDKDKIDQATNFSALQGIVNELLVKFNDQSPVDSIFAKAGPTLQEISGDVEIEPVVFTPIGGVSYESDGSNASYKDWCKKVEGHSILIDSDTVGEPKYKEIRVLLSDLANSGFLPKMKKDVEYKDSLEKLMNLKDPSKSKQVVW
jgi:tRNA A-37 threonylcarbamoyl transferase component Bud32